MCERWRVVGKEARRHKRKEKKEVREHVVWREETEGGEGEWEETAKGEGRRGISRTDRGIHNTLRIGLLLDLGLLLLLPFTLLASLGFTLLLFLFLGSLQRTHTTNQ